MTDKEKLEIALKALRDIIERLEFILPEASKFSGTFYLAKKALMEIEDDKE